MAKKPEGSFPGGVNPMKDPYCATKTYPGKAVKVPVAGKKTSGKKVKK